MGKTKHYSLPILLLLPQVAMAQAAGELDYSGWGHHHFHTWWKVLLFVGLSAVVLGLAVLAVWLVYRTLKKKGSRK